MLHSRYKTISEMVSGFKELLSGMDERNPKDPTLVAKPLETVAISESIEPAKTAPAARKPVVAEAAFLSKYSSEKTALDSFRVLAGLEERQIMPWMSTAGSDSRTVRKMMESAEAMRGGDEPEADEDAGDMDMGQPKKKSVLGIAAGAVGDMVKHVAGADGGEDEDDEDAEAGGAESHRKYKEPPIETAYSPRAAHHALARSHRTIETSKSAHDIIGRHDPVTRRSVTMDHAAAHRDVAGELRAAADGAPDETHHALHAAADKHERYAKIYDANNRPKLESVEQFLAFVESIEVEDDGLDEIEEANWAADAVKHPGRLHKYFKVPEGQKIPMERIKAAYGKLSGKGNKSAEETSLMRAMALGIRFKGGDVPGGEKKKGLAGESVEEGRSKDQQYAGVMAMQKRAIAAGKGVSPSMHRTAAGIVKSTRHKQGYMPGIAVARERVNPKTEGRTKAQQTAGLSAMTGRKISNRTDATGRMDAAEKYGKQSARDLNKSFVGSLASKAAHKKTTRASNWPTVNKNFMKMTPKGSSAYTDPTPKLPKDPPKAEGVAFPKRYEVNEGKDKTRQDLGSFAMRTQFPPPEGLDPEARVRNAANKAKQYGQNPMKAAFRAGDRALASPPSDKLARNARLKALGVPSIMKMRKVAGTLPDKKR